MSDAFTFTITPPTIQRGRSSGSLSATRSRTPSQSRGMSPSLKRASQDSLAAQFAQTSVSAPLDPLENGTLLYSAPQGGEPDFSMLEPGDPLWQSNLDLNMAGQSGFIPGQNVTFITGDLSSILGASAGVAYDGSNLGYQNLVNVGMSYYPLDATENYAPDRSPSPNGSGSWNELHGNGSSASGTRSASTTVRCVSHSPSHDGFDTYSTSLYTNCTKW